LKRDPNIRIDRTEQIQKSNLQYVMNNEFQTFITNQLLSINTGMLSMNTEISVLKDILKKPEPVPVISTGKKILSKKEFEDLLVNNLGDNVLYDLLETVCQEYHKVRKEVLIVAWCESNNETPFPTNLKCPTEHLLNMRKASDESLMIAAKVSLNEDSIPQFKIKDTSFVLHSMLTKRGKRGKDSTVVKDKLESLLRKGFLEFIGSAWDSLNFKYHGKVVYYCFAFSLR
jgi:hypothetical protein